MLYFEWLNVLSVLIVWSWVRGLGTETSIVQDADSPTSRVTIWLIVLLTYLVWVKSLFDSLSGCSGNRELVVFFHIVCRYLQHFLWNRFHVNVTGPQCRLFISSWGNGLVSSGKHPLPESMLTKFYDVIWRHWATIILFSYCYTEQNRNLSMSPCAPVHGNTNLAVTCIQFPTKPLLNESVHAIFPAGNAGDFVLFSSYQWRSLLDP